MGNSSLCAVQIWLKTAQNDRHDVGRPQVAMHSQFSPSYYTIFVPNISPLFRNFLCAFFKMCLTLVHVGAVWSRSVAVQLPQRAMKC